MRARCAIAGLETTGTKAALIERLEAHHTQPLLPPQATSLDERLKDAHRLGSPTGIDGSTASDHVAAAPPLGVLRSSHLESREACEAHFCNAVSATFDATVCSADDGHDHSGDAAYEWAGSFAGTGTTWTWRAQKVGGAYADPTMSAR